MIVCIQGRINTLVGPKHLGAIHIICDTFWTPLTPRVAFASSNHHLLILISFEILNKLIRFYFFLNPNVSVRRNSLLPKALKILFKMQKSPRNILKTPPPPPGECQVLFERPFTNICKENKVSFHFYLFRHPFLDFS